jgi:sterol desaturase/sphingolipid hydroxylase (fatty acid hydroxylase superfamily)
VAGQHSATGPVCAMLGVVASDLKGFWRNRHCPLERMSLGELVTVYLRHHATLAYLGMVAASIALVVLLRPFSPQASGLRLVGAVVAALVLYPLVEYGLHRFLLHGRFLYKTPFTVTLWKRIHYDHHSDPDNLEVLFGALPTTLPPLALATLPVGALIAGPSGAAAAFAAGAVALLIYEFCHCVDHLPYAPRHPLLKSIKRLHLLHHLHNEHGNYGISSFVVDRLLGTYYDRASAVPRSATVFDLGYTGAERVRYPWLAQRSEPGDAAR